MTISAENGIVVFVSANSIYEHSLATIKFSAKKSFSVQIFWNIVSIVQGKTVGNFLKAKENDKIYSVELEISGIFRERRINEILEEDEHIDNAANTYGMRFYPFVSSHIQGKIITRQLPISAIIIELPDMFRLLWKSAYVFNPDKEKSYLRHSYGQERSKYVFRWKQDCVEGEYNLDNITVKLGGATLLRLTEFPTIYLLFYLIVISFIAFADWKLLAGTVVAVWIFMLQQFNSANVPQRTTLLREFYFIEGIIIAVWAFVLGLSIIILKKWFYFYNLIPLLILLIAFFFIIFQVLSFFEQTGKLPKWLEMYWQKKISKRIMKQEAILLEENSPGDLLNEISAISETQKIESVPTKDSITKVKD